VPKRLLIVDDSPVMRSFVKRTLEIAGLVPQECLEASNGAEALRILADYRPDLILTDINMPVLDGESLLRALKANPESSDIPVVVVSTDSTENRVESLLKLGASGYVKKPFAPERLSELLDQVVPSWQE
jgi:two-component system chemotaxis response regulator CheY